MLAGGSPVTPLADPDDPDRPMRVEYDKKRFQENTIKGKELLKSLRSRQSDN
jgi:hypothetical protein